MSGSGESRSIVGMEIAGHVGTFSRAVGLRDKTSYYQEAFHTSELLMLLNAFIKFDSSKIDTPSLTPETLTDLHLVYVTVVICSLACSADVKLATCSCTVEPLYNEVLGTMKITLLYQVSHYIRVKKQRNVKSWDQQNYLVIRGFCYIRPRYNEVPLYPQKLLTPLQALQHSQHKIKLELPKIP